MGLQKEIWTNAIVEGLFADNTFASRSINHSSFVNYNKVHVPNAGGGPGVEKDRTTLPATINQRTDMDLEYVLHEFTTDPIRLSNAESVELSYDKRESVIRVCRAKLADEVYNDLLKSWLAGSAAVAPEAAVKDTVKKCKKQFDADNVPQAGRCFLLEAENYNKLLDELTDAQQNGFLAGADPVKGTVGKWMGFDFYMRSKLDGTKVGFAWWEQAVSRAIGEVEFFDNEKRADWFSDILSFLVRAGGMPIRSDAKGVLSF